MTYIALFGINFHSGRELAEDSRDVPKDAAKVPIHSILYYTIL